MATAHTLVAGRYRLHEQLGAGGMGRVWLARDEMLGRDVAIKEVVPPAGLSEDDRAELRYRILREARTAARLNHPNVVQIYDVVHTEEWPWIVMEYVPSRSLHDVIERDGPLNPAQVARIGLAVLAALTAAHEAGVLHRDVKPGNVLIAADGRVVLTDFGLATFDTDSSVTLPGLVVGSAQYIAPERARDGTSTAESDLWSLGATLYAAVEGRSPYARSTVMATLSALATALPDPPQRAGPLKPALSGLLRRRPGHRLSAAEAHRLLLRATGEAGDGRGRPGTRRGREPAGFQPLAPVILMPGPGPGGSGVVRPAVRPVGPRRGRRTLRAALGGRGLLLGAATLALVLLSVLGVLLLRAHRPHDTGVTGLPSAPPAAPVLGTDACGSTGTPTPVGSMPPKPGWDALPPNFVWYLDPGGFRISVPVGWAASRGPAGVCFTEPGNTRVLAVEPFRPDGDPVAHWQRWEGRLDRHGRPRDYQDLGISRVPYYFLDAAQWEYTYLDATGTPQHGLSRCFVVSAQRAYTIAWRTREFDWQPNQDPYRAIIGSFSPAA